MKTMTIGHAARRAGVGVETIRFYERGGLIEQPPSSDEKTLSPALIRSTAARPVDRPCRCRRTGVRRPGEWRRAV